MLKTPILLRLQYSLSLLSREPTGSGQFALLHETISVSNYPGSPLPSLIPIREQAGRKVVSSPKSSRLLTKKSLAAHHLQISYNNQATSVEGGKLQLWLGMQTRPSSPTKNLCVVERG